MLKSPRDQGGLDILDIGACNKAIEVMWVKALLSKEMLTWSLFTHDIISHIASKTERNINQEMKMNIFLQSFSTKKTNLL